MNEKRAIEILQNQGFKFKDGMIIEPHSIDHPWHNVEIYKAIDYLCDQFDYGFILFKKGEKLMGVMSCNRNGCENIMCNRLSSEYGYICNECFEELCKVSPVVGIKEFMESSKEVKSIYSIDYAVFLTDIFKSIG